MTTTSVKKIYSKEFLAALDDALARCGGEKTPTVLIYRQKGQQDIRVKIDMIPPTADQNLLIFEG